MENEFVFFMPKAEGTAEVRRNGVIVWAEGTGPNATPPGAEPLKDASAEPILEAAAIPDDVWAAAAEGIVSKDAPK